MHMELWGSLGCPPWLLGLWGAWGAWCSLRTSLGCPARPVVPGGRLGCPGPGWGVPNGCRGAPRGAWHGHGAGLGPLWDQLGVPAVALGQFGVLGTAGGAVGQLGAPSRAWGGGALGARWGRVFWGVPTDGSPGSGAGRLEAGSEEEADRGEPGAAAQGGDDQIAAAPPQPQRRGVGADPRGDGGAPQHQRPGQPLEAETEIPGEGTARGGEPCAHPPAPAPGTGHGTGTGHG